MVAHNRVVRLIWNKLFISVSGLMEHYHCMIHPIDVWCFVLLVEMLWVWIGLEKVNDTWTWNGNLVDPLSQGSSWYDVYWQPNDERSCSDTVNCGSTISMNNVHCQHTLGFIGEKLHVVCRLLKFADTENKKKGNLTVLLTVFFVVRGVNIGLQLVKELLFLWKRYGPSNTQMVLWEFGDFRAMIISAHQQEVLRKCFSTEFWFSG